MKNNLLRCVWLLCVFALPLLATAQSGRQASTPLSIESFGYSNASTSFASPNGVAAPASLQARSGNGVINFQSAGNTTAGAATATCGPDTVLYPLAKATGFPILTFSDTVAVGQWYDAPQSLTISGFSFFAWVDSATNQTVTLNCYIYQAGADSLPTGGALATTTVTIDSNFFNGNLNLLEKHATFPSAITVTGPYVVVVENLSPISIGTVSNDYTTIPRDGLGEELSSVFIGGAWVKGINLTLGGNVFDADFLLHPHVTYQLTAAFLPSPAFGCVNIPTTILNQSSPIAQSPFYNQTAFIGSPNLAFTWNYGDGSPRENVINGNHVYTSLGAYTVTLTDTIFGWNTQCVDSVSAAMTISSGIGVNANFNSSVSGLAATFTDQSSGGPVAWAWDYGDGTTSNIQNPPAHTYASAGVYTVCLIVGNLCGTDTICQQVVAGGLPAASCDTITNFTGTPLVYPATGGGYVAGHNSFLDSAKADRFTLAPSFAFQEVLYGFGWKESPTPTTSKVIATVWDASGTNGTPGAVLASQDLFYTDIDTTALTSVLFPNLIQTNGNFYVGIQLIYAAGDTVALITNTSPQTNPATAWELFSNGTWVPYDDPSSWGLSVSNAIFVIQAVEADFNSAASGLTATFTDQSVGAGGWIWDFGDGNTSTLQNPTHTYATAGTYTVCLVAFDGNCNDTLCAPVTVTSGGCPNPIANFSAANGAGNTVNFTDLSTSSTGISNWVWDFGDGNTSSLQSPTHTYAVAGNYTVCLTVTDSCGTDSTCQTITAGCPLPIPSFSNTTNGLVVNFTDLSLNAPTGWLWDFGDGNTSTLQNPTHTYATVDTFTVCLSVINACGADSICQTVITGCTTPTAAFTQTSTGLTFSFTDGSTGNPTAWLWDFGDGNTSTLQNPNHTYTNAGTYNVCLTAINSCGSIQTCQTVTAVCPTPVVAFSSTSTQLTASFTDNSTGGVTGWFWEFGDGGTSTQQNPSHTYAAAGTYTVCLTALNTCGSDSICQQVTIVCPAPVASYGFSSNNLNYTFNDLSAGATSWFWDFGDGGTSTLQNPNHVYNNLGTFQVCLIASNSCGSDTSCQSITVTCPTPTAMFSSTANQLAVTFNDMSTGATGWQWDFGDGSGFSIQQNPTYTYSMPGTYNVCLTAVNSCGTAQTCSTVTVSCPPPAAAFSFLTIGNVVSFTEQSPTSTTDFNWDFGDGTTSTAPNPSHTYTAVGTYTVCLITGNLCGTDTICQSVIINCVPPTAGFQFSVSNDSVATFTNQASANATAISWTFGDGTSSTAANPSHTYQGPGTYTVCQIVSNTCGLDTVCQTVTITCQNPTAGFTTQVTNATAVFTDGSILPSTYSWDFGDGTTSTDANPTHVFPGSGTYQVCLTVTNFCGSNTTCQNLVISCQPPSANFSFFNGAGLVDFTDLSTNNPTNWFWNFGDGGTDTVQNPTHGYLFTGQFFVCLRSWNECGSGDTCFFITVTTVGQEEALALEQSFSVFPNPNQGQFQLEVDLPKPIDVSFRITNVLGQELFRFDEGKQNGLFRKSFNLNDLAAGPYMLEMQAGEHRLFHRVVVE